MSEKEESGEEKKVTAAITDEPQEEFISQENVASKSETAPAPAPKEPRAPDSSAR